MVHILANIFIFIFIFFIFNLQNKSHQGCPWSSSDEQVNNVIIHILLIEKVLDLHNMEKNILSFKSKVHVVRMSH